MLKWVTNPLFLMVGIMIDLSSKLAVLIQPIVEKYQVDLVDLEVRGHAGSKVVEVFVDQPNGVTIDICARVSRDFAEILDKEDDALQLDKYRLEVSSPGIDRPLKTEKDFKRHIGKTVELKYKKDMNVQKLKGQIADVRDGDLHLTVQEQSVIIQMDQILSGKIQIQWTS